MHWEPRIRLHRVQFESIDRDGRAELDLEAEMSDGSGRLDLSIPLRMGSSI